MTVTTDLAKLAEAAGDRLALPRVERLCIPPQIPDPGMQGEFGVVMLSDGSAGFFFALLGDTLRRLHAGVDEAGAAGGSPLALAAAIESADPVERAVALGAISAVSQHVFRRAGYRPRPAANSTGGGSFAADDHVGMVGLFPSLSRRLRAEGVRLTVLELREDRVQQGEGFEVTLDPTRLTGCNKVLCTASTLINGTLDAVLSHCAGAEHVALIGPSASCFPDPLFSRRVHVVGGASVLAPQALVSRLGRGEPWGDAIARYTIEARAYPGFYALLDAASRARPQQGPS